MGGLTNQQAIIGLIIAFISGGGLSAFVVALSGRAKNKAEATDLIGQSWERVIEKLESIITRLEREKAEEEQRADRWEGRVRELNTEIETLRAEVARLRRLLIQNGVDPTAPSQASE